jgi:hypothetical protein
MLDLDAILARIRYTQTTSTSSHRLHWLNRDCRFCCTAVVAFAPVSATICAAAMATGLALVGRLRLCFKWALVTSSVAGGRLISGWQSSGKMSFIEKGEGWVKGMKKGVQTTKWKCDEQLPRNFELFKLNFCDRTAYILFSASVVLILPVVVSSVAIKLRRPLSMVATDQLGFHELGWKSLMVRHNLVSVWNLPDGVDMRILGGLKG